MKFTDVSQNSMSKTKTDQFLARGKTAAKHPRDQATFYINHKILQQFANNTY